MNLHPIALFLTATITSLPALGVSPLTPEEQNALNDVNLKYNYENKVKELNDGLTARIILQEKATSLSQLIDENEMVFGSSTKTLAESLSKGDAENVDELYSSIKKVSAELAALKKEREEVVSQIVSDVTSVKTLSNELTALRSKNARSLQELRKTVLLRLQKNASNPSDITGQVSVKCRTTATLGSCVSSKKSREFIIEELLARNELESKNTKIIKFNIDDATMALDGSTTISASMTVQGSISDATRKRVDRALGLSEVSVTIASDVQSQFYIDGMFVGEGLSVSTTVPNGSHGVYVSHSGQHQSAVVSTHSGDEFYFPFNGGESHGSPAKKMTPPAPGKSKISPPSDEISLEDIKPLSIGSSGNMEFFIPTHSQKTAATFYSGEYLQGVYAFDAASQICRSMGKKSSIASEDMYFKLLTNGNVLSVIGVKSSFWIAPENIVTVIDGKLHYKKANAAGRYNVLCMRESSDK